MQILGLKIPILGKFRAKIDILSTHNFDAPDQRDRHNTYCSLLGRPHRKTVLLYCIA